ncbi:MAG TPA: hypothetical protein VHV77_04235, partial [Pirellulales bacterium]|nr:hypothetical protein [Pirellulales bacterium]
MTTRSSIDGHLQQIARRLRWRSLLRDLTLVWLLGAIAGWLALWYSGVTGQPWPGETLALVTIAAAAIVVAVTATRRIDLHRIAHAVERCYPDLQTRLLAAVEQQRRLAPDERGYLSQAVIEQAELHGRWNDQWKDAVPTRQLIAWSSGQALALLLLLATFAMVPLRWTSVAQATSVESPAQSFATALPDFEVEPGDVELERGADLLVLARFAERTRLPNELTLVVESPAEAGEKDQRLPMQQSLSDPIFAARVPEVQHDLTYRVAAGNHASKPYSVTVFVYPELERSDAELRYPEYTELAERHIEDVRQVTAVEGTELRWLCRLNKPVKTARLVSSDGESLSLTASPDDPTLYTATRLLTTTERWRLELTDDRGRENRETVEFVAKVVPNRPPELKLTFPRRDVKVSPLQEVPLEAQVVDDFGVARWGVAYDLIGKKSQSIVLGEKLTAKEKHVGRHLVDLEA